MRDSFLKLLSGESSDEIVFTADLTYWVDGRVHHGKADPHWQTEIGHLEFCRKHGVMPYFWYGACAGSEPRYHGVEVTVETHGNHCCRTWHTPVGRMMDERARLSGSWSEAPVRYAVQSEDDLKVLLYILERRRLEPANLDTYRDRCDLWKRYEGVPILTMPQSPLPAMLTQWAGVENTAYLMADCPDLLVRAMDLMAQQEAPIIDAICALAPSVVHFADNLSSENSAGYFDRYMADRYRRRLDELHRAGVACAVHLDGTVRGLLPKLAAVGFDAVEALTPAPVGDVTVHEMRKLAGRDDLVLWGGVPGAMFAPPFTWEQVREHVESVIACWAGGPFVLSTADQVPPDGEIMFCDRIRELIGARQFR